MSQNQVCRHLSLLLIWGTTLALPLSATAQRIPVADDTLGNERSIVSGDEIIRDVPSNRIDGGARRGANLFHSFREFNVDAGRGAYFTNPDGVENILTRITGNSRSDILGTLGVLGSADLFFINPNGILFGKNARLDLGGSFISSSADGFAFDNGFVFSATDPQAPPLLTVSAPIGLQYGNSNPGTLEMRADRLGVPNGQTLILAGGFIYVNNAEFYALGGRLELAGVTAPGQIGLTQQGPEWRLNVPDGLTRANILMENNGSANVRDAVGGSINITARNFTIAGEGSRLRAGTFPGLGAVDAQAGDVTINATETVNFNGGFILNLVLPNSIGNAGDIDITANRLFVNAEGGLSTQTQALGQGGDIRITTNTLSVTDGGDITAITFGQGSAGNITLRVRDTLLVDGVGDTFVSGIYSSVEPDAVGEGGNIRIIAGSLTLTDGGNVSASTFSQGNAGDITIAVRDAAVIDGVSINGDVSGASSSVEPDAVGKGGNIRISAGSLTLSNGAEVDVNASGRGRAGTITLNAPTLTVSGGAQILAETESTGNGGSIVVNAPESVNLRRVDDLSPVLSVETSGAGQAGDITINTPSLTLAERARITATATVDATNRQGGGSITLNASKLDLAGVVGVFAETQGETPAGTLRLNPYRNQPDLDITLTPNSQISASTSGSGQGGDLIVTAPESINITGAGRLAVETSSSGNAGNMRFTTRQLNLNNGVNISASTTGTGQAGDIEINAETVLLNEGSQVSTNTASAGLAGDITIRASDQLLLTGQGTGLFASTALGSTGRGGNITIDPELVQITDGATIAVDSQGRGTGGNIALQAEQLVLNRGSITAETNSAQGGNLSLDVEDLTLLRNNSLISATAGTDQAGGDGGNITINSNFITAVDNENSDISANAFTGRGGNVEITTQGIFGIEARSQLTNQSDITASSQQGVAGVVTINTPDVDPSRGLIQLPVDLTDASQQIAQTCPTGEDTAQNQFVVTGRGGLPPTPSEAVSRDAVQVDLVTVNQDESSVSQSQLDHQGSTPSSETLVEAQGWQVEVDGTVTLVAAAPKTTIVSSPNRLIHCR